MKCLLLRCFVLCLVCPVYLIKRNFNSENMSVSRKGGHGSEERLPAHRKAPRPHSDDHRLSNVPSTPEDARCLKDLSWAI